MEVNSFWHGERLTTLERLCISSFLQNGIGYNLYVYEEPAGLPDHLTLRDAAEIVPRTRLFRYPAGSFNAGSVAGFSDLFRYSLIHLFGCCWVDTDHLLRELLRPGRRGGVLSGSDQDEGEAGCFRILQNASQERCHAALPQSVCTKGCHPGRAR